MQRSVIVAALVAALGICGFAAWRFFPPGQTYFTDAATIKESVSTARVRDVLWEPPIPLVELINAGGETYEPRLSNDAMTLYFVRGKAGGNADIYLAHRTPQGWSDPQPIAEINSPADDLGPAISADGESLYFYSNRAGGKGGYDLWMSHRTENGWREPTNLGPEVNSPFNDYGPALTSDARTLYFSSNRPQPGDPREPDPAAWPATLREEFYTRTYDLYSVALTDSGAGKAVPLPAINTPQNEGAPAVSAFGDFLYFASDRPGGSGGFDLYRSRRLRDVLQSPTNLGSAVNTAFHELDPALSMNGFGLDFSSDRPLLGPESPPAREYRLYHTNSREVFAETEQVARTPIDWAAIWRAVGPNLLWALLALALLLAMLLLFKGGQNRKLSLLTKCLLASLALHFLLMLLFNVWEVAASLTGEFRRGSAIKVALTGPASHSIAAQITGSLSEVTMPDAKFESTKHTAKLESILPPMPDIPLERKSIEFASAPLAAVQPVESNATIVAPPVFETDPSMPIVKANFALEMPATDPSSVVAEPTTVVKGNPPTAARAEVPAFSATAFIPRFVHESVPSRIPIVPTQDVVRLAADQIREAQVNQPATLARDPPIEPAVSLQEYALTARLPESQVTITDSEIHAAPTPTPSQVATRRQAINMQTRDDSAARVIQEYVPPPGRFDVQPARTLRDLERQVPDSDPGLPLVAEVAPDALVIGTITARAIKLALPDVAVTSSPERLEADYPAIPSRSVTLARADLPIESSAVIVPHEIPTMELNRARLDARANPTSARFSDLPGDSPADRPHLADDKRDSLLVPAFTTAFDLSLPTDLAPPQDPDIRRTVEGRPDNDSPGPDEIVGVIRGTVTNKATREPLGSAQVRLVLSDRETLTATTDSAGRYALEVPDTPDFFAFSASLDEFVPQTRNIELARLEKKRKLVVNFSLEPQTQNALATEAAPDVHHLGDDRFSGDINSQFQKKSEGSRFSIGFDIAPEILTNPLARAEVRLMAKGVQRRHKVFINNRLLSRRLDDAPEDGGFGEFIAPFDPALLAAGVNTLRIEALPSDDDIDDFEFVNIRIYLIPSAGPEPDTGASLRTDASSTATQ